MTVRNLGSENNYSLVLITLFFFLMTACSDKNSDANIKKESESSVVKVEAVRGLPNTNFPYELAKYKRDLPNCVNGFHGTVWYVFADESFYVCESSARAWITVDLVGPRGKNGHNSLVFQNPIPSGNADCPGGGINFISFLDINDDGQLTQDIDQNITTTQLCLPVNNPISEDDARDKLFEILPSIDPMNPGQEMEEVYIQYVTSISESLVDVGEDQLDASILLRLSHDYDANLSEQLASLAAKQSLLLSVKQTLRDSILGIRELLLSEDGLPAEVSWTEYDGTILVTKTQILDQVAAENVLDTLENQLDVVGEEALVASAELNTLLEEQQQFHLLLSNLVHTLHDTAVSIINNIR